MEPWIETVADHLVALYEVDFGGKARGRFRISNKHLRRLTERKRLYESDVEALRRALYQKGFILVDMETYFVLLSANTFVNYRRVNEGCL